MNAPPPYQCFSTFARTREGFVLSVLSKRTYRWTPSGEVGWADEQRPLTRDIELVKRGDRNGEMVRQGRDAWPLKLATDVVVTGHAHSPGEAPVPRLDVGVSIGAQRRQIVAIGPRFVEYRGRGQLAFSPPAPFTSVNVSWWNAYGGMDPMVLPEGLHDTPVFAGKPILELFPGAYPRNPCGIGYMIAETEHLLDGLALPLLEQPTQLLTPDNYLVRDPKQWWRRPAPAAFGWSHSLWFPRILHCGGKPYHMPPPPGPGTIVNEFALGVVEAGELAAPAAPAAPGLPFGREVRLPNPRLTNEAAPDMILPFLAGDEVVRLQGFSPRGEQGFRLPRERPQVQARVDGIELQPLGCYIHTLAIDADAREFYLLFSTRFPIDGDMAEDLTAEDPLDEIIPRCEVRVDARPLEREEWPSSDDDTEGS
jgi:hypothetical protein